MFSYVYISCVSNSFYLNTYYFSIRKKMFLKTTSIPSLVYKSSTNSPWQSQLSTALPIYPSSLTFTSFLLHDLCSHQAGPLAILQILSPSSACTPFPYSSLCSEYPVLPFLPGRFLPTLQTSLLYEASPSIQM